MAERGRVVEKPSTVDVHQPVSGPTRLVVCILEILSRPNHTPRGRSSTQREKKGIGTAVMVRYFKFDIQHSSDTALTARNNWKHRLGRKQGKHEQTPRRRNCGPIYTNTYGLLSCRFSRVYYVSLRSPILLPGSGDSKLLLLFIGLGV